MYSLGDKLIIAGLILLVVLVTAGVVLGISTVIRCDALPLCEKRDWACSRGNTIEKLVEHVCAEEQQEEDHVEKETEHRFTHGPCCPCR